MAESSTTPSTTTPPPTTTTTTPATPPPTALDPQPPNPNNPNPPSSSSSTPPPPPSQQQQQQQQQPSPSPHTLNPNNPNSTPPPPSQLPPHQQQPPSFRPQFTPLPPHLQPQQQQQQQQPAFPGYPGQPPQQLPGFPPQQQPGYPGQPAYPGQPPQQQQQQMMYPGQQPPQQQQQGGFPRPPYMGMPPPNGYLPPGTLPPNGVLRYPYPPITRPGFPLRPGPVGAPGTVSTFPRPPLLIRPPVPSPILRPIVFPVIIPVEKPQTTVYVGKIAPSVENEFIHSLLELCGPIKSWKRAQDPSDGTPKRFGFCEFESAEGVLRALRLLSKCKVDGEELVLNVNQATRDYLERYVNKKKDNLNKQSEAADEEAKKEGDGASVVEKGEDDVKKESDKPAVEEPKKDAADTENKENETANFGLITDEDRNADREALEKLTNMIEERIKNKPLPPPPPPSQRVAEGAGNSNSEVPSKSGDKDSDIDAVKNDEKNDDELTSETKPANRAGTVSPDRNRRNEYRGRDRERDRDRREKERELDRLERERERERQRRERDRELEIQKAERIYKEQLKEWEVREKDREYKRKYEREKDKERERERRRLIVDQEDESDDDSRKRRRKSEIEEKRRRRRREKEEDMADRLKEAEEIEEAKKRAEEERQRLEEKQALEPPSAPEVNGGEAATLTESVSHQTEDDAMEEDQAQPVEPVSASYDGDGIQENGKADEPMTTSDSPADVKASSNAPMKKLGFGLMGSGKRTNVPSVFHEEEDEDAQNDKKMRPLVPIDYSAEDTHAANATDAQAPVLESGKRANPQDVKTDVEKEKSRRSHDRSSHRERERDHDSDNASRAPKILDAKQLIDMIPKTKDDLFSYEINWAVYDEYRLHERMRPWISKKITEFLGEEETTLVEFIVDKLGEHVKAVKMLDLLQQILDEEAEMFVLKMWRMLIFEIKRVETGLVARPGA